MLIRPTQIELLQYFRERYEHVSYERVCRGIGIPNIYEYLRDSGFGRESPEFAELFGAGADRTRLIIDAALRPTAPCPLYIATMDIFIDILGAEAGNLALKVLATGGVYRRRHPAAHVACHLTRDPLWNRSSARAGWLSCRPRAGPCHRLPRRDHGAASLGLDLVGQ